MAYSGIIVSAWATTVVQARSSSSPTHVSITNTYVGGLSTMLRACGECTRLYSIVLHCGKSSAGTDCSEMPW